MRRGVSAPAATPRLQTARASALLGAAVVMAALLLLVGLAMRRGINHDEHQFVASAALIEREGLLPWRDFAYFHVPTLSYLDAALFRFSDRLLLSARLLSVAASGTMLLLLMGTALRRLSTWPQSLRLGAGSLVTLLLILSPAFMHASGRAWNHDLPILLSMAAFLLLLWVLEHERAATWAAAAGLLLGLAVGTRLSFAPLMLPFALAALFWKVPARRFWLVGLWLAVGAAAGLLPTLWTAAQAPAQAWFGNFAYAALNTRYYRELEADAGAKLADFGWSLAQPGNLLLFLTVAVMLVRLHPWLRTPGARFWLLLWPFMLLGVLAPTPMQMQYVYVLLPFAALGLIMVLGHETQPGLALGLMTVAAVLPLILAAPRYAEGAQILFQPGEWSPNKVHARGALIRQLADSGGGGTIFTLSPVDPLEGGARIDPRTATGPFAWRVAALLSPQERATFRVFGDADLVATLDGSPPRALLTGMHDDDVEAEAAQVQWAQANGYISAPMPDEGILWLAPVAEWGGAIRLGAHTLPTAPIEPGEQFVATFYLQNSAPIAENLNVLVRALNVQGVELYRSEGWPYGSATSAWQVGELWLDGHTLSVPAEAVPGIYRVEMSFYDPASLVTLGGAVSIGHLLVQGADAPAEPRARFGDQIELLRATAPATARAGEPLPITLQWRARSAPSADYTIFVHLVAANGTLLAQQDQPPQAGFFPTSAWRAGWPVDDSITLELPADAPAGTAQLLIGLYERATGARLPVAAGGDSFPAATVEIIP